MSNPLDFFNPDQFFLHKNRDSLNSINRPEDALSPYPAFPVRQEQIDIDNQSDLADQEDIFDTSLFLIDSSKGQHSAEEVMQDESACLGTESSIILSREGLRKQRRIAAAKNSHRLKKNDKQIKILSEVYKRTKGQLDLKSRNEIMAKTGLEWIQIYKWFFDRVNRKRSSVKRSCCDELPAQIFRVIGKDGREIGGPTPIFMVEKVDRNSR